TSIFFVTVPSVVAAAELPTPRPAVVRALPVTAIVVGKVGAVASTTLPVPVTVLPRNVMVPAASGTVMMRLAVSACTLNVLVNVVVPSTNAGPAALVYLKVLAMSARLDFQVGQVNLHAGHVQFQTGRINRIGATAVDQRTHRTDRHTNSRHADRYIVIRVRADVDAAATASHVGLLTAAGLLAVPA